MLFLPRDGCRNAATANIISTDSLGAFISAWCARGLWNDEQHLVVADLCVHGCDISIMRATGCCVRVVVVVVCDGRLMLDGYAPRTYKARRCDCGDGGGARETDKCGRFAFPVTAGGVPREKKKGLFADGRVRPGVMNRARPITRPTHRKRERARPTLSENHFISARVEAAIRTDNTYCSVRAVVRCRVRNQINRPCNYWHHCHCNSLQQ